jgi:hypothetical protein
LQIPGLIRERQQEAILQEYLKHREDKVDRKRKTDNKLRLKNAYIKERAEERTSRFTSRIGNIISVWWCL